MTKEEAIKYLQQLYPNGGHCWLDEQRIEAIGMDVKALQEEPISKDLEEAANAYIHNESNWIHPRTETFKSGAEWQKQQMMKDAVEGLVICDELTHGYKDIVFAIPDVLKVGDKVKLIIIKEDKQWEDRWLPTRSC